MATVTEGQNWMAMGRRGLQVYISSPGHKRVWHRVLVQEWTFLKFDKCELKIVNDNVH